MPELNPFRRPSLYLPRVTVESAEEVLNNYGRGLAHEGIADLDAGIKENLRRAVPYGRRCSQEVLLHFAVLRAVSLHIYGVSTPRLNQDDRLADNLDLVFDVFKLELPGKPELRDRPGLFTCLVKSLEPPVQDFLMRTQPEYFKLLAHHLNLRTFDELKEILQPFLAGDPPKAQRLSEELSRYPAEFIELLMDTVKAPGPREFGEFMQALGNAGLPDNLEQGAGNLAFLRDILAFDDPGEACAFFSNRKLAENLVATDYQAFFDFIVQTGLPRSEAVSFFLERITTDYSPALAQACRQIAQQHQVGELPSTLKLFLREALSDLDYGEQNLACLTQLPPAFLREERQAAELVELKNRLKGFITPVLATRYLEAPAGRKDQVLREYEALQWQVLGSAPVELRDLALTAETIFLAYRPTGFDIARIERLLGQQHVCDLSRQLERIRYKPEGYRMSFRLAERKQTEPFDTAALSGVDKYILNRPGPDVMKSEPELALALSLRPAEAEHRARLLGALLASLEDERVKAYRENHAGKSTSRTYSEARLETLRELLSVIPHEPAFRQKLSTALCSDALQPGRLRDHAEACRWKQVKGRFSPKELEVKKTLDLALRLLAGGAQVDSAMPQLWPTLAAQGLFSAAELRRLKELPSPRLLEELTALRQRNFLLMGCGAGTPADFVDIYCEALLTLAGTQVSLINRELRKIKTVISEQGAETIAFLSKNAGSFFAKAGAEICTADNFAMWEEDRHFHLNIVQGARIIGNVMVYFERELPHSRYLVARGFNPRKDTMQRFDRRSMALQLTAVLRELAAANGLEHVYIPEQTAWHALSNREGMAKEIENLSRQNCARLKALFPDIPTVVNHPFFVTEQGGHAAPRLILLTSTRLP